MNELGESVVKRQEQLAGDRSVWEETWSEIADYVLPRRADFNTVRTAGEQRLRTGKVFDSTPILANEMLAAGLHSLLTNPASDWFAPGDGRPGRERDGSGQGMVGGRPS